MKKVIIIACAFLLFPLMANAIVPMDTSPYDFVNGYYKSNGQYVNPYYRTYGDRYLINNRSYKPARRYNNYNSDAYSSYLLNKLDRWSEKFVNEY